ncbi:MAG TPA: muconolactone Delta-isomerase family protein [Chitinophagaceae bacterium]|jgi:hypothetical protein|nr:muconolactone Delta-isomerase family protein [Chitinophagaceae bacterium]
MEYLVEMTQAAFTKTPEEGIAFIEVYVLPTLAYANKLKKERKIIGGGPIAGQIGFALIIEAETVQEIDEILESMPIWPRMKTTVTLLTSFEGREVAVKNRLEAIRKRMAERKAQQPS